MSNEDCGNTSHPDGPWHPAASLPLSGDWVERFKQWVRKHRYGCGCPQSHCKPSEEEADLEPEHNGVISITGMELATAVGKWVEDQHYGVEAVSVRFTVDINATYTALIKVRTNWEDARLIEKKVNKCS